MKIKDEGCINKFCKVLKKHVVKIIIYRKQKKMELLTSKGNKSYINKTNCYICQEEIECDNEIKKDHCHYDRK